MQQTFQCYRCGAQNYMGQPFCWNCQSPFQWNCPTCKAPVQNTMANCPYCHVLLPWPAQQQNEPKQAPEQPYYQQQTSSLRQQYQQQTRPIEQAPIKKKRNPWLIGILAIILLIIIGGIVNIANSNATQVNKTITLPAPNTPSSSSPLINRNGSSTTVTPDTSDSPTTSSTPYSPSNGTDIVYITKSGTKYHRADCRYLSQSKIAIERAEAMKYYTPCSVCKP